MKTKLMIAAVLVGAALLVQAGTDHIASAGTTNAWFEATTWDTETSVADGDNVYIYSGAAVTFAPDDATVTNTPGNVYLGGPDQNVTTPATFTLAGGTLRTSQMRVANVYGTAGEVVQTGGTLETTYTGEGSLSIGYFDGGADGPWSTYTLVDGTINVAGIFYLGEYGKAAFNQQGGTVNVKNYFGLTRHASTNRGTYNLTGGTLNAATDSGCVNVGFGGAGIGTLNVSGTGVLYAPRAIAVSVNDSSLNVMTGGVVKTYQIKSGNGRPSVTFDGGTLIATQSTDTFIDSSMNAIIKDGGVTIDVPEGMIAKVTAALAAAEDATAGDVVKTGKGQLWLYGQNTFKGKLIVKEGGVAFMCAECLPSYGADKLVVEEGGAIVGMSSTLDAAGQAAVAAAVAKATNQNFTFVVDSGSVTWSEPINLGTGSFYKTGAGILTLTGTNSWTGTTYIQGNGAGQGVLAAARGVGLPAVSHVEVSYTGTWAPLTAEAQVTIGTEAGQLSVGTLHGGVTAYGSPLSLTFGADASVPFTLGGTGSDWSGDFWFNNTQGDQPIVFANPIELQNNHWIKAGANVVTLTNSITAAGGGNRYLYLNGAGSPTGTFVFDNAIKKSSDNKYIYLDAYENSKVILRGTNQVWDLIARKDCQMTIAKDAFVRSEGWSFAGLNAGGKSTLTVDGGTLELPTGDNRLFVASDVNSSAELNLQNNGTITTGRLLVGGYNGQGTFNQSSGTLTTTYANDSVIGAWNGSAAVGTVGESVWNLSGGTASFAKNFLVGQTGDGRVEQTGGDITDKNWTYIGCIAQRKGTWNISGGSLAVPNGRLTIGERGTGEMNVSGDAVVSAKEIVVAGAARSAWSDGSSDAVNAVGTLTVSGNATVKTDVLKRGNGAAAALAFDGATLAPFTDGATIADWFTGFGRDVSVGPNGLTLDTGTGAVRVEDVAFNLDPAATIVKKGTGTLTLPGLDDTAKVDVREGTLEVADATDGGLVHRWSFNGTLEDSVGGRTAEMMQGEAVYTNGTALALAGGAHATAAYVSLGADLLPTNGPVTVEFWVTFHDRVTNAKVFSIGTGESEGIAFSEVSSARGMNNFSTFYYDDAAKGEVHQNIGGTGYLNTDTPYYFAMRFVPVPDGMLVSFHTVDVTTGKFRGEVSFRTKDTLKDIRQAGAALGWAWWVDQIPHADYDEVRVWRAALTEQDMLNHAAVGPDALDYSATKADDNVYAMGASETLLANDYLTHRWTFNGTAKDSVGDKDGTINGSCSYTADNQSLYLGGGVNTSWVDFGTDVLPKTGPVTIELWETFRGTRQAWEKIFYFGVDNSANFITYSLTTSGDSRSSVGVTQNKTATGNQYLNQESATAIQPDNVLCHLALVLNGTKIDAYLHNAVTGELIGRYSGSNAALNLSTFNQAYCWLGKNIWNNPTPNMNVTEMRVWNAALSATQLATNVKLGPDRLPQLVVRGEDVSSYPSDADETLKANNYLTHRWPFDGTAEDVIGAQPTTVNNCSWTDDGKAVYLKGGVNASYVDLGANVLPKTGPVTIELWDTFREITATNEKLFSFGYNANSCLVYSQCFSAAHASGIYAAGFGSINNQFMNLEGTTGIQPVNVLCHLALVFNGNWFDAYLHNAETGALIGRYACRLSASDLSALNQTYGWIGRTFWNDQAAKVNVSEFRVWNAALSRTQLEKNIALGPDVLPRLTEQATVSGLAPVAVKATEITVAEGATVDLSGATLASTGITGSGTVRNGAVVVTDELAPGGNGTVGTLTLAADTKVTGTIRLDVGDLIVCNGTLDLTGATIVVNDPENLETLAGSYVFARAEDADARITGTPATVKIAGRDVTVTPAKAYLGKAGIILIIR